MNNYFVLEYKTMDSKGREKNAQFAGVYIDSNELNKAKDVLIKQNSNKISFQVYNHNNIFP